MLEIKLEERLLEKNTLCIFGQIDDEISQSVCKKLLYLQFKFKEECVTNPKIIILINSPGGVVSSGLAIYDTMKALNCTVITVCIGQASSMAATLLSAGTKGYRYALSNSEIMIHQPLGGTHGQATDIVIHCEHIIKTKKILSEILATNTDKTLEQIAADTERDCYMSSGEAKSYGIIDKILSTFDEVYDEIFD